MNLIIQRVLIDCQALYTVLGSNGAQGLPVLGANFTVTQATQIVANFSVLVSRIKGGSKSAALPALEERKRKIEIAMGYYEATKARHDRQVFAAMGGALIALRAIPAKLTPLIRCITNSIKVSTRFSDRIINQSSPLLRCTERRQRRPSSSFGQINSRVHRPLLRPRLNRSGESLRQAHQESLHVFVSRRIKNSHLFRDQIIDGWDFDPRVQAGSWSCREGNEGAGTGIGGRRYYQVGVSRSTAGSLSTRDKIWSPAVGESSEALELHVRLPLDDLRFR